MRNFIDKALSAASQYTLWDWGWLKMTLFTCGILLGSYLAQFFLQFIIIVWILFIFSYIWIAYRTFVKYWEGK